MPSMDTMEKIYIVYVKKIDLRPTPTPKLAHEGSMRDDNLTPPPHPAYQLKCEWHNIRS